MAEKTIEENMKEILSGDLLKNALNFIEYLKSNDVPPDSPDSDSFSYLGENVCVIGIFDEVFGKIIESPAFVIFFCNDDICEHVNSQVDKYLIEFAQSNVNYCAYFTTGGKQCGCENKPGKRTTIFGKEFNNVCHCPLWFYNPDAKILENIKNLVEIWKNNIAELKSSK